MGLRSSNYNDGNQLKLDDPTAIATVPSIAGYRSEGLDLEVEAARRAWERCVTLGGTI
jgi:hypothetical protein